MSASGHLLDPLLPAFGDEPSYKLPGLPKQDKRFRVRIFRDDEVTELWYENVTHIFWTNDGTILTICLPDEKRHAHWPRERINHYDIFET